MNMTLHVGPLDTYKLQIDDGRDLLIQSDVDFPRIAETFGWVACECGATDGTIDCVHRTAVEMIAEARGYLDEHFGETVDDPGYF